MEDRGFTNTAGSQHARVSLYLTTPIAYLNSIPNDPFLIIPDTVPAPYPATVGSRYVYYDTVQNQAFYPESWGGKLVEWCGYWLFYGVGSIGNVIRTQKKNDGINPHPTTNNYLW